MTLMFSILITGKPANLTRTHIGGWRELTENVQDAERQLTSETEQIPFILGLDKLYFAAELGFYTGHPENTVNWYALNRPGLGYRYWTNLIKFCNRPAIAIFEDPNAPSLLPYFFERVEGIEKHTIYSHGIPQQTFFLAKCFGYHSPNSAFLNCANVNPYLPTQSSGRLGSTG